MQALPLPHASTDDAFAPPPLISVVVPCFNAGRYLEEGLASIFAQDYPRFDVIVVDDGSTDDSLQRLQELQARYEFLLLSQPNAGVSAALNTGLAYARGTYIATPDLDDLMLPQSLRIRAAFLERHPETPCVGALVSFMDSEGNWLKDEHATSIRWLSFAEVLRETCVLGAPVALYRKAVLEQVGGYDPAIRVQDFQMTLKIAALGQPIAILPERVTRYRRHAGNLSRRYRVLLEADLLAIAPYQDHPAYPQGHTSVVNKALKYAVRHDKLEALRMLRLIPLQRMNGTTLHRIRRLLTPYRPSRK
ncbi:glycosyltransferase family 2 protein [Pseudomonas oryzihabitans]|uniref:glycosyltransferase family 2 protein n=1 Tax=Pseudomonas oryzihabitans TaxID=47885 RepID=UPI0011A99F9C|nr:glycosyltransferase [Pseudomonas psychrotolerans]